MLNVATYQKRGRMADINFVSLGQVLDTSFGRSSTPKTASYSVKFTLIGPDQVLASYAAIVNFGTEKQMIEMKRRYADESVDVIKAQLDVVRANYKKLSKSALSAKEVSTSDSLEIIGSSPHNPKKTAYYRRKTIFQIA